MKLKSLVANIFMTCEPPLPSMLSSSGQQPSKFYRYCIYFLAFFFISSFILSAFFLLHQRIGPCAQQPSWPSDHSWRKDKWKSEATFFPHKQHSKHIVPYHFLILITHLTVPLSPRTWDSQPVSLHALFQHETFLVLNKNSSKIVHIWICW